MRWVGCVWGLCVLLLGTGWSLGAQDDVPVFRSRVQLVSLNLVAQDKSGQPVRDLRAEEVEVFEDGKLVKLDLFRVEQGDTAVPQVAWNAGMFSNHFRDGNAYPGNVSVILLDGLNTQIRDLAQARWQMLEYLRTVRPKDRVAVYVLGANLKIVHDFTSDPASLVQRVSKERIASTVELGGSTAPDVLADGMSEQAFQEAIETPEGDRNMAAETVRQYFLSRRVERTLEGLESIARMLAGIPGRKSLIWISGGFPGFDVSDNSLIGAMSVGSQATAAMRALASAGVAVYPIDARGLNMGSSFQNASSAVRPRLERGTIVAAKPDANLSSMETLQQFAAATGGVAYVNGNGFTEAIRAAVEDSEFTYTLGYYAEGDPDGKAHRIQVKSKRPGVTLRYQRAYLREKPEGDARRRDQDVLRTLWSPLNATGIPVDVAVEVPENGAARPSKGVIFRILLPVGSFRMEVQNGKFVGAVEVLLLAKDEIATVSAAQRSRLDLTLTPAQMKQALAEGIVYRQQLEIKKGHTVVVAVRDLRTGVVGTVQIPVQRLRELGAL